MPPILVAHRGNVDGPNPDLENSPLYITEALRRGFHVQVDVWLIPNGMLYLGHEKAIYPTTVEFLRQSPRIICNAKTPSTLWRLLQDNIHCFSHDQDDCTLTSRGWIWTYHGKELTEESVSVMPEWIHRDPDKWNTNCMAICSDWVGRFTDQATEAPNRAGSGPPSA